ncbi:MAG: tetratricopeptide repeat protein [Acidobacteriaceae bacterium]|nr:tetratricopeptide repeat protein [Acidobacteriaceae bacterium]
MKNPPVSALLSSFAGALTLAALAQSAAPNFNQDVAPIVYAKCAPCHNAGGPGPFPLTSFEEVKKHALQIATVTKSRYMPPWLPSEQRIEFADALRLSDEQIKIISDWVRAGSSEGPSSGAPPAPEIHEGWRLGPPDLIVKAPRAFRVPAQGSDIFWNFVLTPQLTQGRFVRAVDIRPSNAKIVHHANIFVDRTGSQRVHEQSPGAGFPGMDVTVLRSPLDLEGHFLFWKPGTIPSSEPDGLSWPLNPGNDLVLNMHLQPSGKVEWEQPVLGLYFTDRLPARFPYLLQLEHDGAIDIPAGRRDFIVTDSLRLPLDTQVLAIYPHAHYLGTRLQAWATWPNGNRVSLICIPAWDPNWQAVYRFRDPVHLPAGTVVTMRYHYDNSGGNPRNPNHPPRRVEGGNRATDEMGHLWLEVLPQGSGDARRIYAEAWARHQLEKYPNDYYANLTLGALALSRLHAPDAVAPLRKAVRLQPTDPIARNLYAAALDATGRLTEALVQFRLAVQEKPDYDNARFNLAHALARTGDTAGAIDNLRAILADHPDDPVAKEFLDQLTIVPEQVESKSAGRNDATKVDH